MFISAPPPSDAAEKLYRTSLEGSGFVMNLARAWAWRPDVFEGFAALRNQLTSQSALSKREQAVIVCATAAAHGDSYCALAWGDKLAREAGAPAAAAVVGNADAASLTPRDRALVAWARKVVLDPNSTSSSDVEALRRAGFDDRTIFEATVFIAFRLAFCAVNDALGISPDRELVDALPPAVRDAITYGRAAA
jgi:uncharacterized peroxidase-related enzyme